MTQKEIQALIKENETLKKRLAKLEAHTKSSDGSPSVKAKLDGGGYAQLVSGSKSYAGYLFRSLRASDIYKRIRRALLWLSRFRILSTAMRLLSYAATLIEAGTHIVIVSTLLLIFLPLSASFALVTLLLSLVGQKRANAYLSSVASEKNVYVFFPEGRSAMNEEHFLGSWIESLSLRDECTVFVVSPSFWSRAGFERGKYYLHYRLDRNNVVMLRKYYYFSFKRSVLNNKKAKSTTLIY